MRECVDQANAIVLHSKFSHCERAKHFLTCFNRVDMSQLSTSLPVMLSSDLEVLFFKDTTMYTLELMLVEASYDCQEPTKAGLGEAILVVHSIIKRIKPGKKFPSCLLYCMFRVIGMISDEYLFNNETSQEYVGYFYEQLDRGKMGECIAKANSLEETKFVKPNCARAKRYLTCFNTPPIYTLQLESAQSE
ncbi:unnamed protein product [Timema podura]|uniref:Uncharacterized protein n=1 Tax=Timema podura TaxID=61482 RepID=A0ABN7NVK0_TIMPD|nr:unnamed protein product [Timema podura]